MRKCGWKPDSGLCEGQDYIFTLLVFPILVLVCDECSVHAFQNEEVIPSAFFNKQRLLKCHESRLGSVKLL